MASVMTTWFATAILQVNVNMPGGQLQISFSHDFQVSMCGPVHKIASLTVDEDSFAAGYGAEIRKRE